MSNDSHDIEWRCGCGQTNPDFDARCGGCGADRYEKEIDDLFDRSDWPPDRQRHPICDSPHCRECRTGEGARDDFEHDIEEILGRPLTLEERKTVAPYFETVHTAQELARMILAGDPAPRSTSNYGAW